MAPQVKTILLAVDFSEAAQYLAEYASIFAKGLGARLLVLYVSPSMNRYASLYVPAANIQSLVEQILEGANRVMGEFMLGRFVGVAAEGRVEYGYAPEKILEAAGSCGADMIIMGTHGRRGVERIPFGSVAEKVVKTSKIPVLTIRPA
ncbi:UspA domain-containing protein [Solidesulfovibrio carbinoliphilus subsp. oakridgensis]|uniref:UspA domain-containing protein n=1 Tax=Solidesulfovibrio carbinoliphilus subsp. oakridgensis TaxID=694327 RepID=G7Q831_9BACT|nr:universal stress protein [Solidesulfovibrio carbinoliphilus]EHJ48045.1 UspA domain-containing protein [Solidesulfovibrio carbinoliphilus subsp. oakridgensis]